MTLADAMRELEAAGTEQNRRIYRRHGMPEPVLGVSWAKLGEMKKRIKVDHELALGLWESGVADARNLAVMVADPAAMDAKALGSWASAVRGRILSGSVGCLAAATPHASRLRDAWIRSAGEGVAATGWCVLVHQALREDGAPDATFEPFLASIEKGVHDAKNRVREAMLNALISIGSRSDALEKNVLAACRRIGPIEVDHGETGCKTPDPLTYLPKARAHRRAKEAKARRGGRKPAR
jgi:3-methyladenine DNA glycosylase AlkD